MRRGQEFHGPDGQGYRCIRDVAHGDVIPADALVPFGGAPDPVPGAMIPEWLAVQIMGGRRRDE